MKIKRIPQRTTFFFAVEGEGEQSFVKWLKQLSDHNGLHTHLDCRVLDGGGYRAMLNEALRYRDQKEDLELGFLTHIKVKGSSR